MDKDSRGWGQTGAAAGAGGSAVGKGGFDLVRGGLFAEGVSHGVGWP